MTGPNTKYQLKPYIEKLKMSHDNNDDEELFAAFTLLALIVVLIMIALQHFF